MIEIDETSEGGLRRNKHAKQRPELRGTLTDTATLEPFVDGLAKEGSHVFTGDNSAHDHLEYT